MSTDPSLLRYSLENVRRQIADAPEMLGFYELRFYSEGGRPSKEVSDTIETFYYFPSGGTIRDATMNIVYYEPRLDMYRVTRNP